MPDFGFGRCDDHHEMVDVRLKKPTRLTRDAKRKPRLLSTGALSASQEKV